MASLIPPIGTKGVYQLTSPFSDQLDATILYTCAAIRSFTDIGNQGGDVYARYYSVNNLTKDEYERDRKANVAIITLISDTTAPIYVPSSHIASFPSSDAVPYSRVVLGVELGLLPDKLDLTFLQKAVAATVSDTIGVEPTVNVAVAASTGVVDNAKHLSLVANREAAINNRTTDHAKVVSLQTELDSSKERIAAYETILRANGLLN